MASTVSVGLAAAAPHHLRHAASGRVAASEHAMTQDCAKVCTLDETVNVPIQDWATQKQSDVSSAFQAHPDINAVLVAFDGMTTFVDPAVQAAHKSSLNVYTWGGSASVEKLMLQKSSLIAADPAPDETWDAYEAMDQVIRLLDHQAPAPGSVRCAA